MVASFEYRLTKEEYVRGLRVVMTVLLAKDRRKTWRCLQLYAVIAIAIGIAAVVHPGSFPAILLAFALYIVGSCALNPRHVRQWHGLSYEPDLADSKVTFDAKGVTKVRSEDERHWVWPALRRIHELPDAAVLEFVGWEVITLPDRLWARPEDRMAFVTSLRDQANNLLPDFPAEKLSPTRALSLLHVGAVAAAFDIFIAANAGAVLALCRCSTQPSPFETFLRDAWRSGLLTATSFGISMLTGCLIYFGLLRLNKRRPQWAAGVSTAFIVILIGFVVAGYLVGR
jgi:hypothetical protein